MTPPTIETLTAKLEETLTTAQRSDDILDAQAQILDQLFSQIIHGKVSVAFTGEHHYREDVQEWLAFALKIQKQCTDTVKTKGTLDYMNTLNHRITHPHPTKIEKQTSETE